VHTGSSAYRFEERRVPQDGAMIPVMRPLLPVAKRLLPYLYRVDERRIYANFGPLVLEFEQRIAAHLGLQSKAVTSASSGTTALVGAILAAAGRASTERPFALVPAFTFVATPIAAEQCGYRAYLADIDAQTWMLDPEQWLDHPLLERVGVVIPVAPLGRAVPQEPWRNFLERTGIPVVIDGAASFTVPEQSFGSIPIAISFHATKGFGLGEGGAVISTDTDLIARVAQALNFGFRGTRDSRAASTNGKMSEYHAAVGLAQFDGWEQTRQAFWKVAENYHSAMKETGLQDEFFATPEVGISYALLLCQNIAEANHVQEKLGEDRIESRFWYGIGLQHQTYYSSAPQESLPTTEDLAPRLIGLPMGSDLTQAEIARVVRAVAAAR
jgi:dTDP-4-amino-4,6-dideoxygalactose transaminase